MKLLGDKLPAPRLDDLTLAAVENTVASCHDFKNRSEGFLASNSTSKRNQKFLRRMRYETDSCIRGYATKGYYLAYANFMGGIQNSVTDAFEKNTTLKYNTLQEYEDNLKVLKMVPKQIGEIKTLLVEGAKEGITYANESIYKTMDQFEGLQVSNVEDSKFYKQFAKIRVNVHNITEEDALRIQDEAKNVIMKEILPKMKELQGYIFGEYQTHLRKTPGVSSLPNGQLFYQRCIEYHTSVRDFTAQDIHKIGLEEVELLRSQAEQSAVDVGLEKTSFKDVVAHFTSKELSSFSTGNETIKAFKDTVARINPQLDQYFSKDVLTDDVYDLEVKKVPVGKSGIAYYESASFDKTRKGAFYINTQNPEYTNPIEVSALALHEGNPGENFLLLPLLL